MVTDKYENVTMQQLISHLDSLMNDLYDVKDHIKHYSNIQKDILNKLKITLEVIQYKYMKSINESSKEV